jgi:bifunctional non-homologous end joining protein LigD
VITRQIGDQNIELSRQIKILFPNAGITKGEVVDYYVQIAKTMLPHASGRPLTLHRFPDGIGEDGFYQQHRPDYYPDWIGGERVERRSVPGDVEHVVADDVATLAYLADQACISLHGWLSRAPALAWPDRLIFDLDPAAADFSAVKKAARQVAELCDEIGWTPFVMTTGSRGLHVTVPLQARDSFDAARDFAKRMAKVLAHRHSDELTVEQRKEKRKGRLYLDVQRIAWGQTAILPYSLRARPNAPVATPLDWEELARTDRADKYTLRTLQARLAQKPDPWLDIGRHAVSLQPAESRLQRIEKAELD